MDQSTMTLLASGGNLSMAALVCLKLYEMYTNNKKTDQSQLVLDLQKKVLELAAELQAKVLELKTEQSMNLIKIEALESRVFEYRSENAELRGLLAAQEKKEKLTKEYLAERKVAKKAKSINVT